MPPVVGAPWVDAGIAEESVPDDLYRASGRAEGVEGFAAVDDEEIGRFHRDGYLVVHGAFTSEQVEDALEGVLDLIDGAVPSFAGVQFEAGAGSTVDSLPREEKQDRVRKLMGFVDHEPRLRAIADDPRLMAVLGRLLGEAPDLYQDQALLKPPFLGREKPWHQDNAFFNLPPETPVIGVWIALDEAVPENGCMHIIPGSQDAGPVVHFQRRDWQLCDDQVEVGRVLAVPLRPGGCLFFHGLLHHGTPPSRSPRRRRALQIHYKPARVGRTDDAERLAVFGADGKDVTC